MDLISNRNIFTRCSDRPLLHPEYWPTPIQAVLNPAVVQYGHQQVIMLCRITDRRGISYLQVARSKDGLTDWSLDPKPLITGDPDDPKEEWGVEDPRITWMPDRNAWAIVYTIYGSAGPSIALAFTKDFHTVEKYGQVMPPEDKDAILLPEKINGKYAMLHRPISGRTGTHLDIRVSYSDDLRKWGKADTILEPRTGPWWDAVRVGGACPLILTKHGYLMFYHGTIASLAGMTYRVGAAILDKDTLRLKYRGDEWLLAPEAWYEREGNVPNVVFPCGSLVDETNDLVRLYYGAADTCIAAAEAKLSAVVAHTLRNPVL